MKKKWKIFLENSLHDFIFLHKEDLIEHNLERFENELPLCREKKNGKNSLKILSLNLILLSLMIIN